MAITYTPTTNFGAKDTLPTNDPDKVIKGTEFTTEFTAIQTAFSLAAPNASPTFTGTVTIPTADINGGAVDGTAIGANSASTGAFTTLTASGDVNFDGGTFFVDASANAVGIGTTSPTADLSVGSTATSSGDIHLRTTKTAATITPSNIDAGGLDIGVGWVSGGQGPMTFTIGSSEAMRIDSSGNVGIGTTSPLSLVYASNSAASTNYISYNIGNALVDPSNKGGFAIYETGSLVASITYNRDGTGDTDYNADNHVWNNLANTSEFMRIDASGNLAVGVPSAVYLSRATFAYDPATTNGPIAVDTRSFAINRGAFYYMGGKYNTAGNYRAYAGVAGLKENGTDGNSAGCMAFYTNGNAADPAERARIDSSGNLLVGTTGISSGMPSTTGMYVEANQGNIKLRAGGGNTVMQFAHSSAVSVVGSITVTASATTYNTSSDARLKENIADAEDASSLVDAIKIRQFDWKADGSHQRYGMVAQELLEVAPEVVHQPDDPEEMMGVDYSKLVPMLVKEIQSLRARVAQLEGV